MSKPLVTLAMCSMIALFGAIYILVGYLNNGTDLSTTGLATPRAQVSTATQVRDATQQPTPSLPTVTEAPTEGVASQLRSTPTASPTSAPASPTAEPTVTPTVQVTRTAEVSATPTPVRPTPTASPTVDAAAQLIQRVIAAEEQLKTGHIEASVESEPGNASSSSITFDLGDTEHPPRMYFVSTYTGGDVERTTELTIIGEAFWERVDDAAWAEVGAREGVWGQVQSFLPGLAAIPDTARIQVVGNRLSWTDSVRGVDVTLEVDPVTGVPQQLRRASRSTDTVVIVTYEDWNAPVEIQMPPGS